MSPRPLASVVVVSWNGRELLPECLSGLASQTVPADQLEVLVADNGSADGTIGWLRDRHPSVRALAFDHNLGFAEANDRAAREARGEWLVLLNNDAAPAPSFVQALLDAARASSAAASAARIREWKGDGIEFGGGQLNLAGFGFQRSSWHPGFVEAEAGAALPFACGGAMAVKRDLFLELGGFDPDYFAYYEDVDFGWRLNLAGHRIVYAPGAEVRHRKHASSKRHSDHWRHFHWYKNTLLTLVKNAEAESFPSRLTAGLAILFSRVASFQAEATRARERGDAVATTRALDVAAGAAAGLAWVFERWGAVLEKRTAVQAFRRVGDRELADRWGGFPTDFGPEAAHWPESSLAHHLWQALQGPLPLLPGQLDAEVASRLRTGDVAALAAENAALRQQLESFRSSLSWRLGEPVRRLLDALRGA